MLWNGETWDCWNCGWVNAILRKCCRHCGKEKLAQFGHHPDPLQDALVEIERLQGLCHNIAAGIATVEEVNNPVFD